MFQPWRAVAIFALSAAAACNALTGAGDLTIAAGGSTGTSHTTTTTTSSHTTTSTTTTGSTTTATGSGGHGGAITADPCAGVTCSGHGTCAAPMGQAVCTCEGGYHAVGLACAVDETCAGKNCGTCGQCDVQGGIATCVCPPSYAWQGNDCKLTFDPCATANCNVDQYCVPEAHCQPLGACVATCDCSNCPNCGPDNSDGRWNDWQEYCGAQPNQSPATMACNKPCPPGEGCLPYSIQICWPIEGCFSL